MKHSRRKFIRYSAMAGAGVIILPSVMCSNRKERLFLSDLGVCTRYSNNQLLKEAGFSYVEESVQSFLVPLDDEEVFENNRSQMDLSDMLIPACNSFIPGKLKCVGPDAVPAEIITYAETAFRRAQKAGIGIIVFGSSGSRNIPDGFPRQEGVDQFIDTCKKIASIAEQYDVTIVLEPLNKGESNIVNSVAEGAEIVRSVDHKKFMLLADIFHMTMENEGPESIIRHGDLIRHTHIAENTGRAAPGTNGEDFTPYLKALKDIGYNGRMSVECRWDELSLQAAPALTELRRQISMT